VSNTPTSYSGGPGSNFDPGDRLSWWSFSWFTSVPPGECWGSTLKLHNNYFLTKSFPIHHHSLITISSTLYSIVTKSVLKNYQLLLAALHWKILFQFQPCVSYTRMVGLIYQGTTSCDCAELHLCLHPCHWKSYLIYNVYKISLYSKLNENASSRRLKSNSYQTHKHRTNRLTPDFKLPLRADSVGPTAGAIIISFTFLAARVVIVRI
jgi:hypothetical protein